ncbi:bifunctional adenosylcobinamide kinase/adenosylcobinamide-phosphate guanylyltransferase [Pseudoalteromonas sp. SS15]|uniref:bifunctional adenosylcobinamide kinase/adenosylcobinamide-phosphate guanylyltransferase n=1 Tax=Pseudoalteromonas sp. SS15 TaxID=3139393 RepID=UPI003BA93CD1
MTQNNIHLILGGARSGKSSFAEQTALDLYTSGKVSKLVYIATAEVKDTEMAQRVSHHRDTRDKRWQVIEEPWHLADTLQKFGGDTCVLIDCLTLWLTHGLCEKSESELQVQKQRLLEALQHTRASVLLVSNEVGHGIVPLGELSRVFVDQSGWLNQDIAKVAQRVDFIMAGCPLRIK